MVSQILAVGIFIFMFAMVITEKLERHIVTLLCALATLVFVFGASMHSMDAITETLNVGSIFTQGFWVTHGAEEAGATGINWSTIIFLLGMMVMVEGMARAEFFRWLCITIANIVKYKVIPIFITFMIMSAVLAMFIDSITVILFLAAVTVELAQMLKFDPIPMILAEVFCANLGGSATMCGDPPNIIIGTSMGYSFFDFISNTGVIAAISFVFVLFFFYFCFRKQLTQNAGASSNPVNYPKPSEVIKSKKDFAFSVIIFLIAIVMLVTHSMTGLTVAFIGVFIAALTLIASGKNAIKIIKLIDYKTLLFFVGLFVVVGGLEQTGILEIVAGYIGMLCGDNLFLMIAIIIWISGIASAFIDNIPFAATMIPVIKSLALTQGCDPSILAWALAVGTDVGGSATPIGASANVVGTSVAAKEGYPVGWGRYCKYMFPATLIVLLIATVYMCIVYV